MKVGLFSSAKDEGPFILEWVAYHLLVGFDPILIFSNDSTDGTTELLDALDRNGVLSHVLQDLKPGQIPQHVAADDAYLHPSFVFADWLMWLDIDEFLFCAGGKNHVTELIERCAGRSEGVAVNWLIYGDGNHAGWGPGLITQRFLRRASNYYRLHRRFKTLFRTSEMIRGFGIHRPFLYKGFQGDRGHFVNASGQPMHEDIYRSGVRRRHAFGAAPEQLITHEWAAICHYPVKTRDSFELKRQRGQGTKPIDAPDRHSRFREKYWNKYNQNTVLDQRMLSMGGRLQTKMDELLAYPDVSEAYDACLNVYAQRIGQATQRLKSKGSE